MVIRWKVDTLWPILCITMVRNKNRNVIPTIWSILILPNLLYYVYLRQTVHRSWVIYNTNFLIFLQPLTKDREPLDCQNFHSVRTLPTKDVSRYLRFHLPKDSQHFYVTSLSTSTPLYLLLHSTPPLWNRYRISGPSIRSHRLTPLLQTLLQTFFDKVRPVGIHVTEPLHLPSPTPLPVHLPYTDSHPYTPIL